MDAKVGDLILIVADKNSVVFQGLGALRLHMAKDPHEDSGRNHSGLEVS